MTDFPNGVAVPGGASYASPLLDFSPLGQLETSYQQGNQDRLTREKQQLFRNGIPKTPEGNTDYKSMAEKLMTYGDFEKAGSLVGAAGNEAALGTIQGNPYINPTKPLPSSSSDSSGGKAPTRAPAAASGGGYTPPAQQGDTTQMRPEPARAANYGGFTPPVQPQAVTQNNPGSPTAIRALQGRLEQMPLAQRLDMLRTVTMSSYKPLAEWATKELEFLRKEAESTPMEKEVRSGVYGQKVSTDVSGDNRKLTPEQKNVTDGPAGAPSAAQRQEDIKVGGANQTMTPEQKNVQPAPGESAAAAQERIKTRGATDTKYNEFQVADFGKEYGALNKMAESAPVGVQKAQMAKQLTQQPEFYSGVLQPTTQLYKQFAVAVGADPNKAMPQEYFGKITKDMLTDQIKALGQSGVGRVLLAEVQNMQKSIASEHITPTSNRAMLSTIERIYQHSGELGAIARAVAGDGSIPPEGKGPALQARVSQYMQSNPLYTEAERLDPRILGAPTAPPNIATAAAARAWAATQGAKPGDPIFMNGKIVAVP